MSAALAAGYCGEPSVEAFLKRCRHGEYPAPRVNTAEPSSALIAPSWLHCVRVVPAATAVMPVSYARLRRLIPALVKRHRPRFVLSFGLWSFYWFYDTRKNDHGLPHNPFKAIVAPRPIGWITTMSLKGEINLAPYSFFNGITDKPPIVMFSSEGAKDSVAFAEETKEFVCSLATFDLRDQMNGTSAPLPRGECEMKATGLEAAPSRLVPRTVATRSMTCSPKVCRRAFLRDSETPGISSSTLSLIRFFSSRL
jgi:hypothetical protein